MILIAFGANLPGKFSSPVEALRQAIPALERRGVFVVRSSRIWRTAPVPVSDQPDYHNAVAAAETRLSALQLLEVLQEVEQEAGRVRTVRNAPRVLDLDLIAYNDEIIDRPSLIVPHPRMHRRAFVLKPLQDIAPDWTHPMLGMTVEALIADLDDQAAKPTVDTLLVTA